MIPPMLRRAAIAALAAWGTLAATAAPAHAGVGDILDPRHPRIEVRAMHEPEPPPGAELLPALPFDPQFIGRPVTAWSFMPRGFLFPNFLAQLRRPGLSVHIITSPRGHRPQLEIGLGGQWAFVRWHPDRSDQWGFEFGGYGGTFMRFDLEHDTDLLGTDGIWGFLLSGRWRNLAVKAEIGHISGHLGDETAQHQGWQRINYLKEEAVLGWSWEPWRWLRFYGEFAYAVRMGTERGVRYPERPGRIEWGAEFLPNEVWPERWPVYLAVDFGSRQEVGWNITNNLQLGYILWSDGFQRSWRVAFGWYRGRSAITQIHAKRVQWWSISLLADL